MGKIAVLTGDLVKSRTIKERDFETVINSLKKTFNELNRKILSNKASFQIYRGDSFQAIIPNLEFALVTAIIIRARLRAFESGYKVIGTKKSDKPINYTYTDARIAIGIGEVSYLGNKISESQGEAFQKSGYLLDNLKKENGRLAIDTPWENINKEFYVESKLADAVISRWTANTAMAVIIHLLDPKKNQNELASVLNITQPALHKRLVTYGNIGCINAFTERYFELMTKAQ
ncbi:MAG: hypothetical protein IMY72_01175 [Bacteroidetes bacterium]|nr:hypothetical protein [Bacteroidota bacterium]